MYSIIQYTIYYTQYHVHITLYALSSLGCTMENAQYKDSKYLSVNPLGPRLAVLHFSVEVHGQHELRAGFLPGVSMPEPIICLFHLQKEYALEFVFQEIWT